MPSATIPEPRPRRAGCPACGAPTTAQFRPFCSRGCRDRDLIAWFGEDRRIAGRPASDEGEDRPD